MYRWDLTNDTFEAGQFLKLQAAVNALSPDGRYVAYEAKTYRGGYYAYLAVAHSPYFAQLAFFPTSPYNLGYICFAGTTIQVVSRSLDSKSSYLPPEIQERIEPGCPFQVVKDTCSDKHFLTRKTMDPFNNRLIVREGMSLYAADPVTLERRLIRSFEREPFEQVPPPEWALVW